MKPSSVLNAQMRANAPRTHEGAIAKTITPKQQLERSVMATLLFEDQFYESGETISSRIASLVPQVAPEDVADIAKRARNEQFLRHVPLLIAREMARHREHNAIVDDVLANIIQRPDELAEFMSLYWMEGKQPLTNKVKKGLATAFCKFNEYQFAKYNRKSDVIKIRDVMFMVHPKPRTCEQEALFKKIADNLLGSADTWEVALSSKSEDPKSAFERLIAEGKLGDLALLKNLRNMTEKGVSRDTIIDAIRKATYAKVLPFRFISAANHNPSLENEIEVAMLSKLSSMPKLPGSTCILVDVSGSMNKPLSSKSDMNRMDAAFGTAIIARELSDNCQIYSFSDRLVQIPNRRGFSLRDCIRNSQPHGNTKLGDSLEQLQATGQRFDRIIIITDEQSSDLVPYVTFSKRPYLINVASEKNGVAYHGTWIHIDGFSENVFKYMQEYEKTTYASETSAVRDTQPS